MLTKLDFAKKNPNSKQILKLLEPHIVSSSSKLPFSSAERKLHLSELVAYCRHFGIPSLFLTFSPLEMDCHVTLTLANEDPFDLDLPTRQKITSNKPVAGFNVLCQT